VTPFLLLFNHHHNHHLAVEELGHLFTCSGRSLHMSV
jgi:hypothetical protein